MEEVIALENEIMDLLPAADAAAPTAPVIQFAHDILCNGWIGPGSRLDRLRMIAAAMRKLAA